MDPVSLAPAAGVLLDQPDPGDVAALTAACQDPLIARYTSVPYPYRAADAAHFVSRYVPELWASGGAGWVIRRDGALVGAVDLHPSRQPGAEVGYWLAPQARGQGVLPAVLPAVLDFGFGSLALPRIGWSAVVGNWESWRAAWRQGFHLEGVARRAHRSNLDGTLHDMWTGSLLPDDPREPAAPWTGPEGRWPAIPDPRDPEALVRQFHATYALPVVDEPGVDTPRVHMRMGLIAEEFAELMGAVYGDAAEEAVLAAVSAAVAADDGARDTVAAADALADLTYVIYGMALETGIPLPEVLHAVQRSNLSKLGPDGAPLYRADGKVLKGPDFFEPRIAQVLERHRTTPGETR